MLTREEIGGLTARGWSEITTNDTVGVPLYNKNSYQTSKTCFIFVKCILD